MSEVTEEPREVVVPPPALSDAEHLLNLCTLGAGMVISPAFPVGTIGPDVIDAYKRVIKSYMEWADAGRPV